jgi:hypothetical protein
MAEYISWILQRMRDIAWARDKVRQARGLAGDLYDPTQFGRLDSKSGAPRKPRTLVRDTQPAPRREQPEAVAPKKPRELVRDTIAAAAKETAAKAAASRGGTPAAGGATSGTFTRERRQANPPPVDHRETMDAIRNRRREDFEKAAVTKSGATQPMDRVGPRERRTTAPQPAAAPAIERREAPVPDRRGDPPRGKEARQPPFRGGKATVPDQAEAGARDVSDKSLGRVDRSMPETGSGPRRYGAKRAEVMAGVTGKTAAKLASIPQESSQPAPWDHKPLEPEVIRQATMVHSPITPEEILAMGGPEAGAHLQEIVYDPPRPGVQFDGRYIPYTGGSAGWFENSGVSETEVPNDYQFYAAIDEDWVRVTQLERLGRQQNKRSIPRHRLKSETLVTLVVNEQAHPAECRDFSTGGICLMVVAEIDSLYKGVPVRLRIQDAAGKTLLLDLEAKVAWATKSSRKRTVWQVGVAFIPPTPPQLEMILELTVKRTA